MLAFGVAGLVAGRLPMLVCSRGRTFPGRAALRWRSPGFVLIVGLAGPILDTSTFFYLSTAPTPELAATVSPRRLPVNAIHGAATASHAAGCGEPLLDQLDSACV